MSIIKITVMNDYICNTRETYVYSVDITDKEEIDAIAEECCGNFLDNHNDVFNTLDIDFETFAEACTYTIEEVVR